MQNYKITVDKHGAEWFVTGLEDKNGNSVYIDCPECGECLTLNEDNRISFEHPKKEGKLYKMKCQCLSCGCVFTASRTASSIIAAHKKEEKDDE